MKRRLLASLLAALMVVAMMATTASAAEAESESSEIQQTLDTVFNYLNDQEILLRALDSITYEIPVGENMVSVTVENTPVVPFGVIYGPISYDDIERGVSYIHTTTVRNFYLNSGTVIFKVYYYCWGDDEPGKVRYRLTPTEVTIDVDDPTGCTLIDSSAEYDPDWTMSGAIMAEGTAEFERVWPLNDLVFSIKVDIDSHDEGYISSTYQYET